MLPDAEQLQLCGEITGCRRIMEAGYRLHPTRWDGPDAEAAVTAPQGQVQEATSRIKERLIPRTIELPATAPAGVVAKARVVADLFGNSSGRRSAAARALLVDLEKVLADMPGSLKAGGR